VNTTTHDTATDRDALFAQYSRLIFHLARKWYFWCVPFEQASVSVEDLAQEFTRAALKRFPRWKPERVSFPGWVKGVTRGHASHLRKRALNPRRARRAVSLDDSELVKAGAGRQLEPWVLAALREEPSADAPDADVPPVLRECSQTLRDVYRIIRDAEAPPTASGIITACRREKTEGVSKSTICHALTQLRRLGLTRKNRRHEWRLTGKKW
jgi:DNA-directed RNA polymerase specialized sigma24 family protein